MEWQILHQMPCALRLMGHKQYVSTALLGFDVAVLAQLGGPFGNLRRALFLKPGPTMQKQMIHKFPAVRLMKASDRKSTRLNSSHVASSYAVFCLQKIKNTARQRPDCRSEEHTSELQSR